MLLPQEWQVDLAAFPVLLTLLGTPCSGCHWEHSSPLGKTGEKCTVGEAYELWTLYLCFCLFGPCFLDGKNLKMTKYWPAVFSKPSSRTQECHCLTFFLTHTQFYEFTFRYKNLHLWRDWLAMTSWLQWLHFDWWRRKKVPVYNLKLAHKEKRSSNQPREATRSRWSALLITSPRFSQDLSLFLPRLQTLHLTHSLLPQCRETTCALKASAHGTLDISFRTRLLWLKAPLPVLPRASLTVKSWPPILARRTPPLGPEDKPKERVLPSLTTPKGQTCLWKEAPCYFGKYFFTNLKKIPVKNQKNKPFLYPGKALEIDGQPARSQVLSDIPKTWIRQESLPSEQKCAREQFLFLLGIQDFMISSSLHFLKCRVRT